MTSMTNKPSNVTRRGFVLALAAAMSVLTIAPVSRADEMDDLKASFKARLSKLKALQDSGVVGETFDGWVALVKGDSDGAGAIVSAENADRTKLYDLIAKKQQVGASVVAERNGVRNFGNAAASHYLKTKDGTWVQKKDLKS